jgi:hypothetical protein
MRQLREHISCAPMTLLGALVLPCTRNNDLLIKKSIKYFSIVDVVVV